MSRATTATLRRRLFTIPGRLVHTARRLHLRLPANWPSAGAFLTALTGLNALPMRSRTTAPSPPTTRKTSKKPADRQDDHGQSASETQPDPAPAPPIISPLQRCIRAKWAYRCIRPSGWRNGSGSGDSRCDHRVFGGVYP